MWRNSYRRFVEKKWWMGLVLPVWVFAGFILAQVVVGLVVQLTVQLGVSYEGVNAAVFSATTGAAVYALSIALVVLVPWLVRRYRTTREDISLGKDPSWWDFLLAPGGYIVYMIISALLLYVAGRLFGFVDLDRPQDTGFSGLRFGYEYLLAFITLVVVAPVAEEVLFRGYLLGKLRRYVPVWVAVLITSLLFAAVHLGWGSDLAWNVAIDVFALSVVMCVLRLVSGRLWPAIMLHMIKNGLAFYLLFINPTVLGTLGG